MTPRFHPAAEKELAAAMDVGEARGTGLGLELLREVQRVTALICNFPELGEKLDAIRRRFPLTKFPFGVIFRIDGDTLRILALAHRRQRPRYWRSRK
jgi:plasmid stabilization system protein ParE